MIKIFFLFLSFFCLNLSAMIIDNLNDVRAKWSAISDQVMGGISEVNFMKLKKMVKNSTDWKVMSVPKIMVDLFNLGLACI